MRDRKSFLRKSFWVIIFLLILSIIHTSQVSSAEYTKQNISIVALIDNSGSMDFAGHDKESLRFQAGRILIDKCKVGDKVAFVDFSGKSVLLQSFTRINGGRKQKEYLKRQINNIKSDRRLTDIDTALRTALQEFSKGNESKNKKAVVLLTDGEIDTVIGSKREKEHAASLSEIQIMNNTVHGYLQNDIALYVVALTEKSDQDFLKELANTTKSPQQEEEEHYFFSPSNNQLVDIFSQIISQLRGLAVSTHTFQVNGQLVRNIPLNDPFAEEAEFQFTFEKGKRVDVKLRDPNNKTVQPVATEDTYQLYAVQNPAQGIWRATISGDENTMVTQTIAVEEEIQIATPFPSEFQKGTPWPIVANIKYKGKLVAQSQFNVEIDGYGKTFFIEELTLSIQEPNGTQQGPYMLKNCYGDYIFTYKSTNTLGLHTLLFELKGNISGKDVTVKTEKRVRVNGETEMPQLTFREFKNFYSVGEPINLEIEVTENADSMEAPYILADVSSPNGYSTTVKIPRKKQGLYGLAYKQTNVKCEYIFTIPDSGEYSINAATQSATVLPSQKASPILPIGILLGVVLLSHGITAPILLVLLKSRGFQKRTKPKPRQTDAAIEETENIEEDTSEEVSEENSDSEEITPPEPDLMEVGLEDDTSPEKDLFQEISDKESGMRVPDRIIHHSDSGITQLSLQKKSKVIYFFDIAVESGWISVNNEVLRKGGEVEVMNNDVVNIGTLSSFEIVAGKEDVRLQPDLITRDLFIKEEIDENGLIIWNLGDKDDDNW